MFVLIIFLNSQQGVTLTSVQPVTVTAEVPVSSGTGMSDASNSGSSGSSGGLSTGAKIGIGAGVGGGVGALLLAGLAWWLWRRRKQRVSDDFKWPELGDGTGSGATAAGIFPNATNPTGNNRFEMDDEELFDGEGTTQAGHGAMMSERDPSFLSSAAYSQSHPTGYGAGMAGLGAGAGAAAAGAGAAGLAASQGGRSAYGGSDRGDYYSQDGHGQYSPQQSQYGHGGYPNQQNYGYEGGAPQPAFQQGGYPNSGYPAGAAPAAAAGGAALGRSGSIASTAANNYQVGSMPEYGDDANGRRGGRNRLSVVNALDDVEE